MVEIVATSDKELGDTDRLLRKLKYKVNFTEWSPVDPLSPGVLDPGIYPGG